MSCPDVTVVVCTYNRADSLREALRSLAALQTDGAFAYEIVVINNGSTDDTAAVISEAAAEACVPIRGVEESRKGIAISRNRGIAEARGQWIAFFDDDQLADRRWLAELLALARAQEARAVGGARTLRLPDGKERPLPPMCRWLLGEDCDGEVSDSRYGNKVAPNTGNILLHRSVFEQVGVFDEALTSGEDSYLHYAMRQADIPVWYNPAAVVEHVIPAHRLLDEYFRWTCLRHGWNMARLYWKERGPLGRLGVFLARTGHAAVVLAPGVAWYRLRGKTVEALGFQCRLWRAWGYIRGTMRWMAPRLFPQEALAARLDFRAERQQFAPTSKTA